MFSKTIIAFLLIFFGGCAYAIISHPFWGVLVYELHYFLNPPVRWWYGNLPDIRFSMIVASITLIAYFIRAHSFKVNKLADAPQIKWLFLFIIVVIAATMWAVNVEIHIDVLTRFLKVIVFAVLIYKIVDTPRNMEILLSVYLTGIFYISWIGWQVGRSGDGRLEGIGGADCMDANGTAAVVVTAIPLLIFYILFGKKRWVQLTALVGLAFTMNCLILLNSRGAFLAMVAAGVYFTFHLFAQNVERRVKIKAILGIVVCAILFFYLTDNLFWTRMSTLKNINPDQGAGLRVYFWLKTFEMLKDYPLGLGASGYTLISWKYLPAEWLSGGLRAVHSIWFETLAEYGFQGLILFIGFIYSSFSAIRRARLYLILKRDIYFAFQAIALQASFISLLIACTFIDFLYGEVIYWLPMFMAAFANIHMIKPQRAENNSAQIKDNRPLIAANGEAA